MAPPTDNLIKIVLPLEEGAWHGYEVETVWARPTDELGFVQLENSPFFAKGLSYLDLVEVEAVDGQIVFQRVVRKSGHGTYRVMPADASSEPFKVLLKQLTSHGCTYESGTFGMLSIYAFDVLRGEVARQILPLLAEAEQVGTIDFVEGDFSLTTPLSGTA